MQLTLLPLETVVSALLDGVPSMPMLAFNPVKLFKSLVAGAMLGAAATTKEFAEIVDAMCARLLKLYRCRLLSPLDCLISLLQFVIYIHIWG